jgi:hypothetical protein
MLEPLVPYRACRLPPQVGCVCLFHVKRGSIGATIRAPSEHATRSTSVLPFLICHLPREELVCLPWRLRPGELSQHGLDDILVDRGLQLGIAQLGIADNHPSELQTPIWSGQQQRHYTERDTSSWSTSTNASRRTFDARAPSCTWKLRAAPSAPSQQDQVHADQCRSS